MHSCKISLRVSKKYRHSKLKRERLRLRERPRERETEREIGREREKYRDSGINRGRDWESAKKEAD